MLLSNIMALWVYIIWCKCIRNLIDKCNNYTLESEIETHRTYNSKVNAFFSHKQAEFQMFKTKFKTLSHFQVVFKHFADSLTYPLYDDILMRIFDAQINITFLTHILHVIHIINSTYFSHFCLFNLYVYGKIKFFQKMYPTHNFYCVINTCSLNLLQITFHFSIVLFSPSHKFPLALWNKWFLLSLFISSQIKYTAGIENDSLMQAIFIFCIVPLYLGKKIKNYFVIFFSTIESIKKKNNC